MLWNLIQYIFGFGKQKGVYGSASWLRGFKKWGLLNRWHGGFIVSGKKKDRLSLAKSFTHVAVAAPTGAGKGNVQISVSVSKRFSIN